MSEHISVFAPVNFPTLPTIEGISIGTTASGLRYTDRDDMVSVRVTTQQPSLAAVFTTNRLVGEPVKWCQQRLPNIPKHLLIAAGNANVFTGNAGWRVLEDVAADIALREHISPDGVYFAMTGVIGEVFNAKPLLDGLQALHYCASNAEQWQRAAQAIMTTDTYAKGTAQTAKIGNSSVEIAGFAKGSGMVAPDMATMLAFLFTDADIPQPVLQQMIHAAMTDSFHSISVDSDTSTSDSVMCIATGARPCPKADSSSDTLYDDFRAALQHACNDLAYQVVADGEGVSKLMEVQISGAESPEDARTVALSIANSPLVKTALSGEDANWGRIIMAVGKAGVAVDPSRVTVHFGSHLLAKAGGVCPFDVAAVDQYVRNQKILISVNLGVGSAQATIFGNDLSYEYIRINADYRS